MSEQTCCDKNIGEQFTCGQLRVENDRLKTELERERTGYKRLMDDVTKLHAQLTEAREEVESIGYKPLAVIKEEVRQEAARECYEIGNKLLQQGYVTMVISKYMYEIQDKFGLEG